MKLLLLGMFFTALSFSATESSLNVDKVIDHEVLLSLTQAKISHGGGNSVVGLGLGYNYSLNEYLQVGASPSIYYSFGEAQSIFFASLMAGPTLNYSFNHRLQNAFFVSPQAGVNVVNSWGGDESWFSAQVEVGKRFEIAEFLVYRPSVIWKKDFHQYESTSSYLQFNVLSFAAVF